MNTNLNKLRALAALAVALAPFHLQAGQINGGISFAGDYRPVDAANNVTADLTLAKTVYFGPSASYGGIGPTFVTQTAGDFSSVPNFTTATMASSIVVNPAGVLPAGALWSVGGFSLTLSSISQGITGSSSLMLSGVGTVTGAGFDPTPGTWIATLNTIAGTYSWSFSSGTKPCTGQIGDFVWNDLNHNGCQDAGEPGIPNVVVDLYQGCPGSDFIATTTTDANGYYLFTGLCAGTYTVRFHTPFAFVHTVANQGCGGTPGDAHNPNDSNCQCTGSDDCDVCVTLPTDNAQDLTIDCGYYNVPPEDIGCRVTGGSNKETNNYQAPCILTTQPTFVSHGGQVGAPFSVHADFTPNSTCISGEWQHNRHLTKNSLVGVLHASGNGKVHQFDSLLCACLPCPENPNAVGVVGTLCNPGDRICGPEPRKAPANKICFSGVGDYSLGNGNKTLQAVFRVDIEDRSEGNSHSSTPPPDRYRIRIWLLGSSCGRNYNADSTAGLLLRLAASADSTKIANLATTEDLKINIAPDIDDGGDMTQGNHQIHPATGATCNK